MAKIDIIKVDELQNSLNEFCESQKQMNQALVELQNYKVLEDKLNLDISLLKLFKYLQENKECYVIKNNVVCVSLLKGIRVGFNGKLLMETLLNDEVYEYKKEVFITKSEAEKTLMQIKYEEKRRIREKEKYESE